MSGINLFFYQSFGLQNVFMNEFSVSLENEQTLDKILILLSVGLIFSHNNIIFFLISDAIPLALSSLFMSFKLPISHSLETVLAFESHFLKQLIQELVHG